MPTIPISLKINRARPCLIVGGGQVALRKVLWLIACGARTQVISLEVDPELETLARQEPDKVILRRAAYSPHDLAGGLAHYQLVIAATNLDELNRSVAEDAGNVGVPVNVVDQPELCTFFVPAVVQRENLQIAISTSGAAPSLAARIRGELEQQYPTWYGIYTTALGIVRQEVIKRQLNSLEKHDLLNYLASRDVAKELEEQDLTHCIGQLRRLVEAWLSGAGRKNP